jgi:hypothetical protein
MDFAVCGNHGWRRELLIFRRVRTSVNESNYYRSSCLSVCHVTSERRSTALTTSTSAQYIHEWCKRWRNIRKSSWTLCCCSGIPAIVYKMNVSVGCFKFQSAIKWRSRDSVVSTVTRLRAGRSGARIPVRVRDFSLLQNVQTVSGIQAPIPVGTGGLSLGWSCQVMKLTTHVHVVPRLKTSRAIILLTTRLHGVNRENFTI